MGGRGWKRKDEGGKEKGIEISSPLAVPAATDGAGHGSGDLSGVLSALSSSDARDAQVIPVVHQRLQDHLRLEAVGDRSHGRAHEHRPDEADRSHRVGQRAVARAGRQGKRALRGIDEGRQGWPDHGLSLSVTCCRLRSL